MFFLNTPGGYHYRVSLVIDTRTRFFSSRAHLNRYIYWTMKIRGMKKHEKLLILLFGV